MIGRRALALLAFPFASLCIAEAAGAQEPMPGLAAHFQHICGTAAEAGPSLPGTDVAAADAPGFFAGDLRRATESRVVKIGDRFAMRALVPSSADPQHLVILKCAVASSASFSAEVEALAAILSASPTFGKTAQGFDYARLGSGERTFAVYGEPDNWVSIYRWDMMMQNIPRKYLKKGTRPAPPPSVR